MKMLTFSTCRIIQIALNRTEKLCCRNLCKKNKNDENNEAGIVEPTNCCMSGCANCVWIEYAHKLVELYKLSDKAAQEMILQKIKDPTMRAFLELELKSITNKPAK